MADVYRKTRTRIATMTGYVKKITLAMKTDYPEYQIVLMVKELSTQQMTELLALHKADKAKITISCEEPEPQPTLDFGDDEFSDGVKERGIDSVTIEARPFGKH